MDLNTNDLIWLHGDFVTDNLPPERIFLKKYFKKKEKKFFLYYMNFFKDYKNFIDHTGIFFSQSIINRLNSKYHFLIENYTNAKKNFDMKTISELEAGIFVVPDKFNV